MTWTIERSKWLRGSTQNSMLLRDDGKMCCIGQVCRQLGLPDFKILDKYDVAFLIGDLPPEELSPLVSLMEEEMQAENDWVAEAYRINDRPTIDDATRERELTALARANGHDFVFVD